MKIKLLTLKLLLALIALSIISIANAKVSLNPRGIGQVLIYPYYTVNNNMNTLISLTNATDEVKALKIKFLEGKNNHDVLVFNIYIAPHDEWTGALIAAASTVVGHQGENSVRLITSDDTCTVPTNISLQEFLPYAYEADSLDTHGSNMSRVTEGHIQVFDMGTVTGEFAEWAMTSTDLQDCEGLNDNWKFGGAWDLDSEEHMQDSLSASLFGAVTLIDVNAGIAIAYNADAITGFTDVIQHFSPSNSVPNLNSGTSLVSSVVGDISWSFPYQAISSLFMMKNMFAEYIIDNGIGANTETVITFPTKQFHIESLTTEPFNADINTCEAADVIAYNRDGETGNQAVDLCWGTNVLEFAKDNNGSGSSTILGSNNVQRINTSFDKGWVNFEMNQSASIVKSPGTVLESTTTLTGLPYTGFTIQRFINSNLSGGILANYAGLVPHKGSAYISSTPVPSK